MKKMGLILLLMAHMLFTAMPSAATPDPPPAVGPALETARYCTTPLHILFDVDKVVMRDAFLDEVRQIGTVMHQSPSSTVRIAGHADDMQFSPFQAQNVANYLINMELSRRRAESVANYLVNMFGIDRARFTLEWFGDTQNEHHDGILEGWAGNRRVDVILDCVTKK